MTPDPIYSKVDDSTDEMRLFQQVVASNFVRLAHAMQEGDRELHRLLLESRAEPGICSRRAKKRRAACCATATERPGA